MAKLFTSDHEWLQRDGDIVTIGITNHAQSQLGDIVFLELPAVGRQLKKGDAAAVVESVKAASDVYTPLTGTVVEVNDALVNEPSRINVSAESDAWFFKLRFVDETELKDTIDEAEYLKLIG